MKKFVLVAAGAALLLVDAYAFDVRLLANNKEAFSRELTQKDVTRAKTWADQHRLGQELKKSATNALAATFNEMERIDTTCEVGLVERLQKDALNQGVITEEKETQVLITYLRSNDLIDDILYDLLRKSTVVSNDFTNSANLRAVRPYNVLNRQTSSIDLEKLYAPVKNWPNDITRCSFDVYDRMLQTLSYRSTVDRDNQIERLNYLALSKNIITLETFNKLEVLRKRGVLEWGMTFKRYADLINNAKDKLTKNPEAKAENDFSVEYVSRRNGLTQRENLYRSYNSTQVMMLAQVIEKTAKRMDAKRALLNWQYTDDPNGETEIYVLSPMEQYRAAIKMLRKDMGEMMRSDAFRNKNLQYTHLIAAAYETGFIKSEELDLVLKFEDFWNPKTSRWKTYSNFAFSLAGTASFYLPAPWNIIGAIGLVLTQSKVVDGEPKPDPDDNWNVII